MIASKIKEALTLQQKTVIAAVLTWDKGITIHPNEVEAIALQSEWVNVKLTGDRSYPMHRDLFRSILQQQQESAAQLEEQLRKPVEAANVEAQPKRCQSVALTEISPILFDASRNVPYKQFTFTVIGATGKSYTVLMDTRSDRPICTCEGFKYRKSCYHGRDVLSDWQKLFSIAA